MSSKVLRQIDQRRSSALPRRSCFRAYLIPVATLVMLACGCGPPEEVRPELHPAKGSLWINGQPAEGAMLVFHRPGREMLDARGTRPTATVDEAGNFALTTYQEGDGAPAGEYLVSILWFDNPDSSSPHDRLGNRFANPQRSEIQVTIEPGRAELEPIRLEGVQLVTRQSRITRDLDQVD